MEFTLNINGYAYTVDVDPKKPLLWVLREDIGLCGTKYSCGVGLCGTCTVLVNGAARRSCVVAVESVGSSAITTIEGLDSEVGRAVKEAWLAENVSQCGYCQPGQVMNATTLLMENPAPSDDAIDEGMTCLCRCGTYPRIRDGIKRASAALQNKGRQS